MRGYFGCAYWQPLDTGKTHINVPLFYIISWTVCQDQDQIPCQHGKKTVGPYGPTTDDSQGDVSLPLDAATLKAFPGDVIKFQVEASNDFGTGPSESAGSFIFKLFTLDTHLHVEQASDTMGLNVSWKILPVAAPNFTVQISARFLGTSTYIVESPLLDDACDGHLTPYPGRDCIAFVGLSVPVAPDASGVEVVLTLTSVLTGQIYISEKEIVYMIGVPPQVLGVAVSQTQTLWTIKWNQPAFFFNADPDSYYVLDITCGRGEETQIIYSNDGQKEFFAQLDVAWGLEPSSGSWMADISVDWLDDGHALMKCEKGSDVAIMVTAGNSFFESDMSLLLKFKAITVPGHPAISNINEIPNGVAGRALDVSWLEVRKIFWTSRALYFARTVFASLCV